MSIRPVLITALAAIAAALLAGSCAPNAAAPRPLAAPSPAEGMVVYVSGGVQLSRDGTWIEAEPGDTVSAGAVLKTGADGYCELQFGDTISVRVEPDTEFRCERVAVGARADVGGRVTAGDILVKVKQLSGSSLSIDTPSAVLGVRGTAFKVSVSGTATRVTVREGTVAVGREGTTTESLTVGQRLDTDLGAGLTVRPAEPADLDHIDAFVPAAIETANAARLVKIVVVVEPADAEILLDGKVVGIGTWGSVLEEGEELTLVVRREGYEEDVVFVPQKGQRTARIARKLKALPAQAPPTGATPSAATTATEAAPSTVEVPGTPAAEPTTAAESAAEQPAAEPKAVPLKGSTFRVDPALGNDPFLRWAAEQFARQVPGFSLVTGPVSANPETAAWPRGADLAGGMDTATQLTYEQLPQLVAAKLVKPLDGWYEWTQLAPALVAAVRVNGKMYGVPIGAAVPILYYNRDLVRSAPGSWQDIAALAREYSPKGVDALSMPSLVPFYMGMFPESRGVQLLVADTVKSGLGTPRSGAVYDAMRETIEESGMPVGLSQQDAVDRFRGRTAALLVDGPWAFGTLRATLGDSLGVTTLPSWGSPPVEPAPYVSVFALFVSASVSNDRVAILKRFAAFLLDESTQAELALSRLRAGNPLAPSRRFREAVAWVEENPILSTLYRQLETAVPMPRGPRAPDAWQTFQEVLLGIRRQDGGEELSRMAEARFTLYGIERRPAAPGSGELRAVIDPAEKSQGLFFRPWDDESDLRIVERGGSRGLVSIVTHGTFKEISYLYLVLNHDPYRHDKAPRLRARIEYFDEPNATIRVVYDSRDMSVRADPERRDTWGAWKEGASIECQGTKTWKTLELDIPDARFARRCNGADLRIELLTRGQPPAVRSVILTTVK